MRRDIVHAEELGEILLVDSISQLAPEDRGRVVVSGSHGGTSASEYAYSFAVKGSVFNDAGVGKEKAGVAGLDILDEHAIMGIAINCHTGRIGDSLDVYENGVVSAANNAARIAGINTGMTVKEAVKMMLMHEN